MTSVRNAVKLAVYPCVYPVDSYPGAETGPELIAEYEVSLGDILIAMKDGEAMFVDSTDTIDFSTYAGDDAGSTPYMIVMTDSSDKILTAYGGAVGAGKTLAADIIQNGDFSSSTGWTFSTGWSIVSEELVCDGTAGYARKFSIATPGSLYDYSFDVTARTSGEVAVLADSFNYKASTVATHTVTKTSTWDAAGFYSLPFVGAIDNFTQRKWTDVPVTGLHIHSTESGTDRKVVMESGFNPNAIKAVEIWQL